jgi:hypothetical protein
MEARLTYWGSHQRTVLGIAPTGKQVENDGVATYRITDGKIVEGWSLGETHRLLHQPGATRRCGGQRDAGDPGPKQRDTALAH